MNACHNYQKIKEKVHLEHTEVTTTDSDVWVLVICSWSKMIKNFKSVINIQWNIVQLNVENFVT